MGFQDIKNEINWKVHFASPIEKVYQALTTDDGRSKYWAEQTKEEDGMIEFIILNYPKYKSKIIDNKPPTFFQLAYFGTQVTFKLRKTEDDEGTDLFLSAVVGDNDAKFEMTAGWVSVLMSMKAAVDFGVDLRNHSADRAWGSGYVDN
jgi:hypothetical protein